MISRPTGHLRVVSLAAPNKVCKELDRRVPCHFTQFGGHCGDRALLDGNIAVWAVLDA